MERIEEIYHSKCTIPNKPKNIDGSGVPKKQQKFIRVVVPSSFDNVEFSEDGDAIYSNEQIKFIEREYERIINGYWFMNNGEATFVEGIHYFYLNYWILEDGNIVQYRDADRRWFIYQRECESKPWVYGVIRIKKRREGATSQATAYLVWKAITQKKSNCGIMSKTGDDAKTAFQNMVVNGFRNLPQFLKPRVEDENPKTALIFKQKKSSVSKTKARGQMFSEDMGMESFINFKNTVLNSYDSGRLTALLLDEGGKFPTDTPINKYWGIVKKTMTRGAVRVGFALIPSTVNDATHGGKEFKEMWDDSDNITNDRTGTGLYRYFSPAYDGYEGFIDEYGISITDHPTEEQKKFIKKKYGWREEDMDGGARGYLLRQRMLIKDGDSLSEEIRMNPFTEDEAFMIDPKKCYFNTEKIYAQLDRIEVLNTRLRKVRFYWKNDKEIDWVDDKEGDWEIYEFPDISLQNKKVNDDGKNAPANTHMFGSGIDPFRSSIISGGKGSMGVCYITKKLNSNDPENSGMPVARYCGRPRMKSLFHDEMLKAAIFWGCKANYENDVGDDFVDYFDGKGFKRFLRKTPQAAIDKQKGKKRSGLVMYGVASRDGFALARQLQTAVNYIESHCHKVFFPMLLEDMLSYEHDNRTKYDDTVAFMISLLDMESVEGAHEENVMLSLRTFSIR